MFRALLWKEWRQLALIRWGGIAIGILLPLAFLAGAAMAQRGVLPTGSIDKYSSSDIMFEILPVTLALGLWPLLAIMVAVQCFSGDRANGTETFLLERPIPRGKIWTARLVAALAALIVVVAVTTGAGLLLAKSVGRPAGGWGNWPEMLGVTSFIAPLAFLGGLIAANLLAVALGAVLAAVLFAALPILFGAELGAFFPQARVHLVPIGFVLPVLLLPAYVAASWLAACRGEPAGRGRVKRSVAVLGGATGAVLILFAIAAPLAVRASARAGSHILVTPPKGGTSLLLAGGEEWGEGGWLIDLATGGRLAFLAPRFQSVVWSPDGARFAIGTWSAPLGAERKEMRVEIRDGRDGHLLRSVPAGERDLVWGLGWTPDGIIASIPSKKNATVAILDPDRGIWRETGFLQEGWATLTSPRRDGRNFLRTPVFKPGTDRKTMRGYHLRPIDAASGRVGEPMTDGKGATILFAAWSAGLSPDGRFATVAPGERGEPARVVAVADGATVTDLPNPVSARWVGDDHLAWTVDREGKTRLFVAALPAPAVAIREWSTVHLRLEVSPDGKALLVTAQSWTVSSDAPADAALFATPVAAGSPGEAGIYSIDDGHWRTLSPRRIDDTHFTQWAGPNTIAGTGPGVVYLEDLDHPGMRRFVLGAEEDLR